MKDHKFACRSCDWSGPNSEALTAKNPFDEEQIIEGCPNCFAIDDFTLLCDEPGCEQEATSGWMTELVVDGGFYRRTCYRHNKRKEST